MNTEQALTIEVARLKAELSAIRARLALTSDSTRGIALLHDAMHKAIAYTMAKESGHIDAEPMRLEGVEAYSLIVSFIRSCASE